MPSSHLAIVLAYCALCVAALLLSRAHYHAARRSGVLALVFVAAVLAAEAAEHALTAWAWLHTPTPPDPALAAASLRLGLSWLRLGLTWGLLLGVRYGTLDVGQAHGVRAAARLTWQGYAGGCRRLLSRLWRS